MRRCLNCMKEYAEQYGDRCPYCGYVDGATQNGDVCLRAGSILRGRYIVGTVSHMRDIDIFYHAWDALFDRQVEIQEYFPRYCVTRSGKEEVSIYSSKQEKYDEGLELFCRNSRELIRLYKEENAATYQACFRENGTAYAVLDDCGPYTVRGLLHTQGPLCPDADDALRMTRTVLDVLEQCHRLGVIHGMVSAESLRMPKGNIGGIVLSDFGAWRYVSGEPGVVGYGSPGPETDVFGAAKLLYELVSGSPYSETDGRGGEQARALSELDGQARGALIRALNHEFKTIAEFRSALSGQSELQPMPAFRSAAAQERKTASLSVPRWLYLAAAGCALLIACAGFWIAFRHFRPQAEESRLERGMVRVPNLVGSSVDEAEKELKKLGLSMDRSEAVYSEEREENQIFAQDIQPLSQVAEGTVVHVKVSLGAKTGVIPSVVGLQREAAETALKNAGFEKLTVSEDEETGGTYNAVLSVSEEPGTSVPLTETITLTVCMKETSPQAEQAEVPDAAAMLPGKTRKEVEAAFQEAGFGGVTWLEISDEETAAGTLLSQSPKAGELANRGSYIELQVSSGPAKTAIDLEKILYRPLEEAEAALEAQGFQVGEPHWDWSDTVAKDNVIRITYEDKTPIEKGTLLEKGTKVSLWGSLGPDPAETTQAETTQAPKQTQPQTTQAPKQTQPQTTQVPETTTAAPETTTAAQPETISPNPETPEESPTSGGQKPTAAGSGDGGRTSVIVQGSSAASESVGASPGSTAESSSAVLEPDIDGGGNAVDGPGA